MASWMKGPKLYKCQSSGIICGSNPYYCQGKRRGTNCGQGRKQAVLSRLFDFPTSENPPACCICNLPNVLIRHIQLEHETLLIVPQTRKYYVVVAMATMGCENDELESKGVESAPSSSTDHDHANISAKQIGILKLNGAQERHVFIERLIKNIEKDNLQLLQKTRQRLDRSTLFLFFCHFLVLFFFFWELSSQNLSLHIGFAELV